MHGLPDSPRKRSGSAREKESLMFLSVWQKGRIMKVCELLKEGFSEVSLPDPDREIHGVYIGDLLSWVMGRARADNAWITIMSNQNVIAVASLADTACVILSEGVTLPEDIARTAYLKEVNVLRTEKATYEAAVHLYELLS